MISRAQVHMHHVLVPLSSTHIISIPSYPSDAQIYWEGLYAISLARHDLLRMFGTKSCHHHEERALTMPPLLVYRLASLARYGHGVCTRSQDDFAYSRFAISAAQRERFSMSIFKQRELSGARDGEQKRMCKERDEMRASICARRARQAQQRCRKSFVCVRRS